MNTISKLKVSVIIPAYNREKYIAQTIESVLNQTYSNIELIVVDDGSTDNTRDILDKYKDKITILEHPGRENRGQSAAINLGLKNITGDYVAILDSDDYWVQDKLEIQVDYLNKHQDTGVIYGNGFAVDEQGEYLYKIYEDGHKELNDPASVLLDCYLFIPSDSLVRAEIFRKIGGLDESLRAAQDHDLSIKIAEVTRLAYIDKPLFYYRRHSQSISSTKAELRWKIGFTILENARRRYGYSGTVVRKRKAVLHFRLFQCMLGEKRYLAAVKHLVLSGIYDPVRALRVIFRIEEVSDPD